MRRYLTDPEEIKAYRRKHWRIIRHELSDGMLEVTKAAVFIGLSAAAIALFCYCSVYIYMLYEVGLG